MNSNIKCNKTNIMIYRPYYYIYDDTPYMQNIYMTSAIKEHFSPIYIDEFEPSKIIIIGIILILIIYFLL